MTRADLRSLLITIIITVLLAIYSINAHGQTYVMSTTTVTTCSGTFQDPGGAADYPLGNNSTMTIAPATAGQYASVAFTSFNTQQDYDLLYAYDGNSTAAPLLGIFSGTTSPGTITATTANASRSLTFRFVSNWWTSGPEPGWSATISCSATGGTPRYAMQNGASYTVCSGNFYDSGGPTHSYTWNETSTMTFCPSTAGSGISLAFGPIDLEQDGDLLYIYDGPNTSSPLIAGFGNSDNVVLPAQTITASTANSTGCLTAQFQSDGWWQNAGWNAAISCAAKTAPTYGSMTGSLTTCSGAFTDNGGPNSPYMDFSNDQLTICSDNVTTPYVTVNFSGVDLWTGFDFLYVYDGTTTGAPLIATYSGIYGPTAVSAASASGCLTFKFTSDGWTQRYGWNATIACSSVIGLPVEWLGFTGTRNSEGVQLDWETASEQRSWYYAVERFNGNAFDSIGVVPAAGNSSHTLSYSFTDDHAGAGWNYYRLKQVDVNGQFRYSSIAAVGAANGEPDVLLDYPATGAQLHFARLQDQPLGLRIYSSTGALVTEETHIPGSADETIGLEKYPLTAGIYFIDVTSKTGFRKTMKYVRQ